MHSTIKNVLFKGELCYELSCNRYSALFCANMGAIMLRLRDKISEIEVLRYDENASLKTIKENIYLYGLPTLYLPNRLNKGFLRTSDNVYSLPVNEPDFNNFIHGFLHFRSFTVTDVFEGEDYCRISSEYIYDEKDEFFSFLPLCFRAEIIYTLSDAGLEHCFRITNNSNFALPVIVGSHTSIPLPFSNKSDENDLRIRINVDKKVLLNDSLVSTGEFANPDDYDLKYQAGEMNPLETSIDNDMYSINNHIVDGKEHNFVDIFDMQTGMGIRYEVSEEYKFWLVWNHWGNSGFCCPEPMTALINAPNIPLSPEITGFN